MEVKMAVPPVAGANPTLADHQFDRIALTEAI
jgi:hypothetical protein